MYVKQIVLTDIKGFEQAAFDFTKKDDSYTGWHVITGENGAGKTAVLKAIAMAVVGPSVVRALQPSLEGWIRWGGKSAEIAAQMVSGEPDKFTTGRQYERPFWSEIDFAVEGAVTTMRPGATRRHSKKGPLNGQWHDGTAGWFAAGYGPFRRLYGMSPEAQRVMSGPGRVARFATLFKEDATLAECESWLKDLSFKALEQNEAEAKTLETVIALLNDDSRASSSASMTTALR